MQLYAGMDIGTAKLTMAERQGVAAPSARHLASAAHRPTSPPTSELARAEIDRLLAAGRPPVLVGGSGLYVRAALDEMEFPGTDPAAARGARSRTGRARTRGAARAARGERSRRPRPRSCPATAAGWCGPSRSWR